MPVHDSTDHKLGDYLLGQATGYSASTWGSLGAQEHRRRQAHRDASFEIGRYPSGSSVQVAAGSGILDAAAAFGWHWTETISDFVASLFSWVPHSFGWFFKLASVVAFFAGGIHYEFTGIALLAISAAGWAAPKIVKGTLQLALGFTLSLAYLCFVAALFVLVLSGLLGFLWLIGQVTHS